MGLLGGIIGAVGSIFGGNSEKKAAKAAADAQVKAAQIGADTLNRQFDITRADNMPWLDAGKAALNAQLEMLGLPGLITGYGSGTFDTNGRKVGESEGFTRLEDSPLYKSLYGAGEEAVLANGSATGGLRGGNMVGGLAKFGRDTLAQVYQQMFANLGGISGTGNQTAATLGGFGQNNANSVAQLQIGAGNAQAGNLLAQGRISANQWNTIGDALGGLLDKIKF